MGSTFANALSGLTANANAIGAVSGNLANLNTYGYKNNDVSFNDLVNESLSGAQSSSTVGGSTVSMTTRDFSQGSIATTNQPYDAAINGNGFFVLSTPAGQQVFTRGGNFKLDSQGHLITQNGDFVQGWNQINGAVNTTGPINAIVVPTAGIQQSVPTSNFSVTANLDASAAVGDTAGTFTSPMQVYDSQGNPHQLTVTYTKTATNSWDYSITIPSVDLAGGTGTTTQIAGGTLQFGPNGVLTSPDVTTGAISVPVTGLSDGAADMNLTWNLYDASGNPLVSQFDQQSANLSSTQDGAAAGQLTSVNIGQNGAIMAQYSNGNTVEIGQLALGAVLNPDSLQDLGNNNFGVTTQTATPSIGVPGTGSRGQITGEALESSNVDIATEFTNMLTYERGYEANSKSLTTEDDIIQTTVNLIQR
jgi:flagellar hook protein FlgE